MIRRVACVDGWIMRKNEITAFIITNNKLYHLWVYRLPLFELNIIPESLDEFEREDLILLTKGKTWDGQLDLSFEQFEEINKTWNKFYEG